MDTISVPLVIQFLFGLFGTSLTLNALIFGFFDKGITPLRFKKKNALSHWIMWVTLLPSVFWVFTFFAKLFEHYKPWMEGYIYIGAIAPLLGGVAAIAFIRSDAVLRVWDKYARSAFSWMVVLVVLMTFIVAGYINATILNPVLTVNPSLTVDCPQGEECQLSIHTLVDDFWISEGEEVTFKSRFFKAPAYGANPYSDWQTHSDKESNFIAISLGELSPGKHKVFVQLRSSAGPASYSLETFWVTVDVRGATP